MVCGCVIRQLLNFWDFFKGESVVDFIRGDFPVAQAVAWGSPSHVKYTCPSAGFDEAQSFVWTCSTKISRNSSHSFGVDEVAKHYKMSRLLDSVEGTDCKRCLS